LKIIFLLSGEVTKPNLFIIFVLTHGDIDGLLLTDQPKEPTKNLKNLSSADVQTYTVTEIWKGLKGLSFFNDCLFLMVLGVRINYNITQL
jgi:hypothetical protein